MATLLEGKPVALEIEKELRDELARLSRAPVAAAVLVGDDESSQSYFRSIRRTFKRVGIAVRPVRLPADVSEPALGEALDELNHDADVDGIIVFQPLPAHLDRHLPASVLDPEKDIDGITFANAGRLSMGDPWLVPSTPQGGMELLHHYDIPIDGRQAVVVGRSPVVGQPMALLLLAQNATVTVCHSRTSDLQAITRSADIVVLAAGTPRMLTPDMVHGESVVIDFGVNFEEGQMVGDAAEAVADVVRAITPVPGGTGVVTQRVLAQNTVRAAVRRRGTVLRD